MDYVWLESITADLRQVDECPKAPSEGHANFICKVTVVANHNKADVYGSLPSDTVIWTIDKAENGRGVRGTCERGRGRGRRGYLP